MVFLTRHEESIKAIPWFAFEVYLQDLLTTFTNNHYNLLQPLNLFEHLLLLLLLPLSKAFKSFLVFQTLKTKVCYSSFSFPSIEAKLHDESRVIQRCFDDNKDDNKGDDKKLKGQSKNEFKIFKIESRTLQDSRGKLISRIKNQDSRDQDFNNQDSRDQDSRLKRRLNQDKYEKVFSKIE